MSCWHGKRGYCPECEAMALGRDQAVAKIADAFEPYGLVVGHTLKDILVAIHNLGARAERGDEVDRVVAAARWVLEAWGATEYEWIRADMDQATEELNAALDALPGQEVPHE